MEIEDYKFIHALRMNPVYNKHLSSVSEDKEKQKQWLIDYKKREKTGKEYYFIICRNDNSIPIGTVRIYDFIEKKNSFCWGSWILNENKTRYAALECAILIYDFAFTEMGFDRCHMNIRKGNKKVVQFHEKFGAKYTGENEYDFLYVYYKEDYMKIRDSIVNVFNKKG